MWFSNRATSDGWSCPWSTCGMDQHPRPFDATCQWFPQLRHWANVRTNFSARRLHGEVNEIRASHLIRLTVLRCVQGCSDEIAQSSKKKRKTPRRRYCLPLEGPDCHIASLDRQPHIFCVILGYVLEQRRSETVCNAKGCPKNDPQKGPRHGGVRTALTYYSRITDRLRRPDSSSGRERWSITAIQRWTHGDNLLSLALDDNYKRE